MALMVLALATGVIVFLGYVLVSKIGLPTTADRMKMWLAALLISAVLFSGIPELALQLAKVTRELPTIHVSELVTVALLVGLVLLGWWGFHRSAEPTGKESTFRPRQRVAPPPPFNDEDAS